MSKFGVGVGEEFPVEDPEGLGPKPLTEEEKALRLRFMKRHFWLGLVIRLAFVGMLAGSMVWLFRNNHFDQTAFAAHHHHGFFPFFPFLLLMMFLMFAYRRHHWHGYGHCHRGCGCGREV